MPYNIKKFDGSSLVTIPDGVTDDQNSTSIVFVGKNVTDYGTQQNESLLWLLENFSATTQPLNKIQGQLWFDKTVGTLRPKVYDGSYWRTIGITEISATEPTYLQTGDLWFDSSKKQLWVKNSTAFTLVGPEFVPGYAVTKWESLSVNDLTSTVHPVVALAVNGVYISVVSDTDFDVLSTESLYSQGITHVYKGISLKSTDYAVYGNVEDSRYSKLAENETVTGLWTFNNASGVTVNNGTSGKFYINGTGQLVISNVAAGAIVLDSPSILPSGSSVMLGSSSSKFNTLYASNVSAGNSLSTGILVGDWNVSNASKFHGTTDNTVDLGLSNARWKSVFAAKLSSGAEINAGTLEGQWTLTANSKLTSPVLQVPFITAGSPSTAGVLEGQWIAGPGSTIRATSVIDSAGNVLLSDINAINDTIAQRDASGHLYAVRFHGALTGNVTGNVTGDVTGNITGGVTGNITGNLTGNVTGNVTGTAVTATNIYGILHGDLKSTSINAGSNTSPGDIVGYWRFSTDSKLRLNYLTAGSTADLGTIQGDWKLDTGSKLQATQLIDSGSLPISPDKTATANSIAQRTGTGGLVATSFTGNLTGAVTGNADSATVAARVTNALTNSDTYVNSFTYNGSSAVGITLNASSGNQVNKLVARDSSGNFSCNAITAVGAVSTPALLAGSPGDSNASGNIWGQWRLATGSSLQATYADMAEIYTTDVNYAPGTLVEFGGPNEVTISTSNSRGIAGIVSTNPAYILNSDAEGVAVALVGRVPCKVVGEIHKGDLLVASHIPGVAMANNDAKIGTVIAKAMETYQNVEAGMIEVMVWRG